MRSGLTERPILNKLNVILAEGTEEGSKVIVYSSDRCEESCLLYRRKSGRISAPNSGIGDVALAAATQPIVYA